MGDPRRRSKDRELVATVNYEEQEGNVLTAREPLEHIPEFAEIG